MAKLLHRPEGHRGPLDDHLPRISDGLARVMAEGQKDFLHDTLALPRPVLRTLAAILVEFAEDLHCGIGLWSSLERHHREFFGTPLPFLAEPGAEIPLGAITPARVRHLLWVLYPQISPDVMVLAPEHVDLVPLAEVVAAFLGERFADLPKDSGVTRFLGTPDEYGWEVKRKLVWLGTKSYLFRVPFQGYAEEQEAEPTDISIMDDFICQRCTGWSGLGALDILADVLQLTPGLRSDLLSWSQRHNAVFEVLAGDEVRIEVRNLISGGTYQVRMNLERNPFPQGSYVLGSLVPWDGQWYWSGQQKTFKELSAKEIDGLKEGYRKLPNIYYRYSPKDLEKARALVREQYEGFVARHGQDWVVYPDGLAMAADWQKAAQEKFEALPPAERKAFLKRHGMKQYKPSFSLPPDLLEAEGGIGVYFNPEEGQEIALAFDDVRSGLAKRGAGPDPRRGGSDPGPDLERFAQPGVRAAAGRGARGGVDPDRLPAGRAPRKLRPGLPAAAVQGAFLPSEVSDPDAGRMMGRDRRSGRSGPRRRMWMAVFPEEPT